MKEIVDVEKNNVDEHRGERESRRRAHTVHQENEGKDTKKDSGGRRIEVSGHCQLEDP